MTLDEIIRIVDTDRSHIGALRDEYTRNFSGATLQTAVALLDGILLEANRIAYLLYLLKVDTEVRDDKV